MARRDQTKRASAFHEAGHAVIARVLGLTCGGATIVPDYEEGTAGYAISHVERSIADWECRGRWRPTSMFRARIMMLMAGRESEIECFGKCEAARFGDDYDLREIDITLPECFDGPAPDDVQRFLARWRLAARDLVRRHRRAVAAVAAALLKHRALDSEQIDAIVAAYGVRLAERVDPGTISAEEMFRRSIAWAGTKLPPSAPA